MELRPADIVREMRLVLDQLTSDADRLYGQYTSLEKSHQALEAEAKQLEQEVKVLTYSSAVLSTLVQSVSVESLVSVERLVSYGLQTVIPDQNLRFGLDVSTKRGAAYAEPYIAEGNIKAPILDAFGGGPAAIVAFLLRLLVCKRLKLAPVLLLDESFSFISSEYVENMSKLLRELAEKLQMNIILVTHQPAFQRYAHHCYQAIETSSGTVFKQVKEWKT